MGHGLLAQAMDVLYDCVLLLPVGSVSFGRDFHVVGIIVKGPRHSFLRLCGVVDCLARSEIVLPGVVTSWSNGRQTGSED